MHLAAGGLHGPGVVGDRSAVTTTATVGRRIRKRDTSAAGCVIVSGPIAVAEALAVTGLVGASDFPVISTAASAATVAATATAAVVSATAAAIAATATSAVASAATAVIAAATSAVVSTTTAAVTATSTPTTISTSTKTKATHIFDRSYSVPPFYRFAMVGKPVNGYKKTPKESAISP